MARGGNGGTAWITRIAYRLHRIRVFGIDLHHLSISNNYFPWRGLVLFLRFGTPNDINFALYCNAIQPRVVNQFARFSALVGMKS